MACLFLGLLVLWAPVIYGSVLPRERLVLILLSLAGITALFMTREPSVWRPAWPALVPAAVALLGLAQSLPWPPFLANFLAPSVAASWRQQEPNGWLPLSLAPEVSRGNAALWLSVAAVFASATVLSRHRPARRCLAVTVALAATFQLAYGAQKHLSQGREVWGYTVEFDRLHGTFVNPDRFATFLLMLLAVCFSWSWWSIRRATFSSRAERRLAYFALPLFVFTLLFAALALTGSRGGLLGAGAGLFFQTLALFFYTRRWQTGALGLLTAVLGMGGLFYLNSTRSLSRWAETSAFDLTVNNRLEVYALTFGLWQEAPWTGTGLATFRQAFPAVQPADLERTWIHAHNNYLEILATTGLVGLAVVVLGIVAVVLRLVRNLRRGRRSEDRAVALAALGAMAAVGVHEMVDFGLALPANAFFMALILGAGCGVPVFERPETDSDQPNDENA